MASSRNRLPTPALHRVLLPPDLVLYVFGILAESSVPILTDVPMIVYRDTVVAILDRRSVVERLTDGVVVYSPPDSDLGWLQSHPDWANHPAA